MEIVVDANGAHATPDIVADFKNREARRAYERKLKVIKKQLRRSSNSLRVKRLQELNKEKPTRCPACGSKKVVKWGTYERTVRSYLSIKSRKISVRRYRCNRCKTTGSLLPWYVCRYRRYSNKALRDMVDFKLWSYAGYRKVAKWGRIHGSSHTTVIREIIKLAPVCRDSLKNLICRFSSIVSIDEVYFRQVKGKYYMGLVAVDARYGRIILERTFSLISKKGKEFGDIATVDISATKAEGIKKFVEELLTIVTPKVIITDINSCYSSVLDEINKYRGEKEKIKHQLCTLHVKWNVCRYFQGFKHIPLASKFEGLKKQLIEMFETDTFERANNLLADVLRREYEFKGTSVEEVFKFLSKNRERLFPFLKYGINRTNNPAEFYFSFVKRFQDASKKFSSFRGISSLLSVFALFYNFMPKMEGRNKGKTPLQMAKWNHKIDIYTFIGYPQCIKINSEV